MTTLDLATIEELERLEREATAACEAFDTDNDSTVKMHACLQATQRFHDKLHENPRSLIAAARRAAELPDVGEPEPCKEDGAVAWEREFREETHHLRILGVALNPTTEEPIGIRVPAHGIDAEEARWLAAALLAAARSSESAGGGR
jgi:DNA-nicking Smr family endonuclease